MNIDATAANAITDPRQRDKLVRQIANEFVGATFFEPMLKAAHNSKLKGKYGHGGRGEDIFQGQLNAEFARNMGNGVKTNLAEALYRQLAKKMGTTSSSTQQETNGVS